MRDSGIERLIEAEMSDVQAGNGTANGRTAQETAVNDCVDFPFTDLGNAERLVAMHGRDMRYCHPWNSWLIYDGRRWATDATAEIDRMAKSAVRKMLVMAAKMTEPDARDRLWKWGKASESHARLNAMVARASSEVGVPVLPAELDADPWLLNVLNGTLDLRTGELLPHDRRYLITKLVPVHYDPRAQCPMWLAFQRRVTNGNEEMVTFKQRAIGYALTGDVADKRSFYFFHGMGNNGKTTELELYRDALGDYAGQIRVESLMNQKNRDGASASPDIADLRGLRFVVSSEPAEGQRLAENLIKYLLGMGTIKARNLYQKDFEFKQTWKLFMDCNHKPVIRGTDRAIWNRIGLVPFDVVIPDEEIDRDLPAKLRKELPGILAWAVRGCLDWRKSGLAVPQQVQDATADYRAEMDAIGRFMEECCVKGPSFSVRGQNLYSEYRKWCENSGETAQSVMTFGIQLAERGLPKVHDRNGVKYEGIGLKATRSDTRDDL